MQPRLAFSLTQLEYVLALHKYGHFAKAAQMCHVTQPTLSMQIQKLEEQLGTPLFDRSKKPILLTEAGKRVIEQIRNVVFESNKIETMIQHFETEEPQGDLNLAIIPTIAPYILPRVLPLLETLAPKLNFHILEMHTDQIVAALDEDEIDVGLLATPLGLSRLYEEPIFYEPFAIFCHKNHALAHSKQIGYRDLKYQDIWLLNEGHCLRDQVLDICALRDKGNSNPQFRFESGSLETLKRIVNSYGGYTLLPELALDALGSKTQVIRFKKPIPGREVGLVYRRKHHKIDLIRLLAKALNKCIPKTLKSIEKKDLDVIPVQ
ncbi:MAG: hydrogen peroxide-inducible genes activator [Flavobacteriales bacterium]|nr:hydrogen peroxide-inducible genes activator [Flavobacteriales bacterium]